MVILSIFLPKSLEISSTTHAHDVDTKLEAVTISLSQQPERAHCAAPLLV